MHIPPRMEECEGHGTRGEGAQRTHKVKELLPKFLGYEICDVEDIYSHKEESISTLQSVSRPDNCKDKEYHGCCESHEEIDIRTREERKWCDERRDTEYHEDIHHIGANNIAYRDICLATTGGKH